MEDELWIALEGELVMDIMNPFLQNKSQWPDQRNAQRSPS